MKLQIPIMQKQTMEVGNNLTAPTTTITSHLQNVKTSYGRNCNTSTNSPEDLTVSLVECLNSLWTPLLLLVVMRHSYVPASLMLAFLRITEQSPSFIDGSLSFTRPLKNECWQFSYRRWFLQKNTQPSDLSSGLLHSNRVISTSPGP